MCGEKRLTREKSILDFLEKVEIRACFSAGFSWANVFEMDVREIILCGLR